jgi:hypothetical protein
MNSYQRLKAENENLKEDIYNLVKHKDDIKGIEAFMRYDVKFDVEKSVWEGKVKSGIYCNFKFNGITNQCKE